MRKALFTIFGAIIGLPMSYYFQSEMLRAKVSLASYIEHLDRMTKYEGVAGNILFSIVIFSVVGFLIGSYLDSKAPKNEVTPELKTEEIEVEKELEEMKK